MTREGQYCFACGKWIELTEPMVDPQVWKTIPYEQVRPTKPRSELVENGSYDQKTKITQQNQFRILGLIQWTVGVEVIDTCENSIPLALAASLLLILVVVVTGGVGEEIHGPAEQLLTDDPARSCNRCLLSQLRQLVHDIAVSRGEDLPCLRHENHITLHVPGGLVVLAVGDLPGEVWNQKH